MLKLDQSGPVPELYLYGLVAAPSWWTDEDTISAGGVLQLLDQLDPGAELIVRINSEGGDVFEGVAIYNALARRGARLETHVDALAASIASVIAMAGDEIVMAGNAMLMIHRAWTFAQGDSAEMAKVAETLQQIDEVILNTYEARVGSKSTREQIAEWVAAETWMTPEEAVERGFADRIGELQAGVSASIRAGRFKHTPQQLLQPAGPPGGPPGQRTGGLTPTARPGDVPRQVKSLPSIAARVRAARARLRRHGSAARG